MASQPDIEQLLDDAIDDAIADVTTLIPVEARIASGELTPEAQIEDEAWAAELRDRTELKARRIPLDLPTFRLLVDAEIERRRMGRRRLAADAAPPHLAAEHDAAVRDEQVAEIAVAKAQRAHASALERLRIAAAVRQVWGSDRRERA